MEWNRKAGQNPSRVVAPTEEEEEDHQAPNINMCLLSVFEFNQETKAKYFWCAITLSKSKYNGNS